MKPQKKLRNIPKHYTVLYNIGVTFKLTPFFPQKIENVPYDPAGQHQLQDPQCPHPAASEARLPTSSLSTCLATCWASDQSYLHKAVGHTTTVGFVLKICTKKTIRR